MKRSIGTVKGANISDGWWLQKYGRQEKILPTALCYFILVCYLGYLYFLMFKLCYILTFKCSHNPNSNLMQIYYTTKVRYRTQSLSSSFIRNKYHIIIYHRPFTTQRRYIHIYIYIYLWRWSSWSFPLLLNPNYGMAMTTNNPQVVLLQPTRCVHASLWPPHLGCSYLPQ